MFGYNKKKRLTPDKTTSVLGQHFLCGLNQEINSQQPVW